MSSQLIAAVLLIAVPIGFNLAFFELGRTFDYPSILRQDPDTILRRFAAGGTGLLLRWHALLITAVAMLPLVALLAVALEAPAALTVTALAVGIAAGLVQSLGLIRWTYAVPELAHRYVAADGRGAKTTRASLVVVFAALHRLLGVGIGEHLGYLFTGLWTLLVSASVLSSPIVAGWLGWVGLPIGIALMVGSLEFVGSNEREGWPLAATLVPIAYIAWSVWLVGLGIALAL